MLVGDYLLRCGCACKSTQAHNNSPILFSRSAEIFARLRLFSLLCSLELVSHLFTPRVPQMAALGASTGLLLSGSSNLSMTSRAVAAAACTFAGPLFAAALALLVAASAMLELATPSAQVPHGHAAATVMVCMAFCSFLEEIDEILRDTRFQMHSRSVAT